MIGIIDYGMGNLLSVANAVEMNGFEADIVDDANSLHKYDKFILPGVGAFKDCIENLHKKQFVKSLNTQVIEKEKPILGICLGMQVMAKIGFERGCHEGLGWFDAEVVKLSPNDDELKVPHIGWSSIDHDDENTLFVKLPSLVQVYFVHSYFMRCKNKENVIAAYEYGQESVTAAVNKGNIFATQFHPEKSQDIGLQILNNFLSL